MRKALLIVALFLVGCGNSLPSNGKPDVKDFGNGVLYFEYNGSDFGYALSSWIGDHRDYKVIQIVEDGTDAYGSTHGYFVVVEKR